MLAADAVPFPFERGRRFSIGELRRFEKELSLARQSDQKFSDLWRVPDGQIKQWSKIREETYPLKLFADHVAIADDSIFRLMPESNPSPVDIELWAGKEKKLLQITTANPARIGSVNGGYDHKLAMEELTRSGFVMGSGPFRRDGTRIACLDLVADGADDFAACIRGLCTALAKKIDHDGTGCELLVFARSYRMTAIDFELGSIIDAAVANVGRPRFDHIYIFDEDISWFVKF